jgi:hypothetical protein
MPNTNTHANIYVSKIPELSGVITCAITKTHSWQSTMIIPPSYLNFPSSLGIELISPLTFKKWERRRDNKYTRISIKKIFSKFIGQILNNSKLGSTLLYYSPVKSPFLSRHFSDGQKAIMIGVWPAFDFTTEHLILFKRKWEKVQIPRF